MKSGVRFKAEIVKGRGADESIPDLRFSNTKEDNLALDSFDLTSLEKRGQDFPGRNPLLL